MNMKWYRYWLKKAAMWIRFSRARYLNPREKANCRREADGCFRQALMFKSLVLSGEP